MSLPNIEIEIVRLKQEIEELMERRYGPGPISKIHWESTGAVNVGITSGLPKDPNKLLPILKQMKHDNLKLLEEFQRTEPKLYRYRQQQYNSKLKKENKVSLVLELHDPASATPVVQQSATIKPAQNIPTKTSVSASQPSKPLTITFDAKRNVEKKVHQEPNFVRNTPQKPIQPFAPAVSANAIKPFQNINELNNFILNDPNLDKSGLLLEKTSNKINIFANIDKKPVASMELLEDSNNNIKIQCTLTSAIFDPARNTIANSQEPNPELLKVLKMLAKTGEEPLVIEKGSKEKVLELCRVSKLANPEIKVQVITTDPTLKIEVEKFGIDVLSSPITQAAPRMR